MKLMNTEETTRKINEVIAEAHETMGSFHLVSVTLEPNVEKDKNGTVYYKVRCKKKGLKTEKSFALYFFERKNGISTFLINGETLDLLFENSTMNSPAIVMAYLKKVLEGDIKWLLDTKEKPARKPYPKKPYQKSSGSSYKKPYQKKPYAKDGEKRDDRPARKYDSNGKPTPGSSYKKPGTGSSYHKPSGTSYTSNNQRNKPGYKKPYQNTNSSQSQGQRSSMKPYYMTSKNETN